MSYVQRLDSAPVTAVSIVGKRSNNKAHSYTFPNLCQLLLPVGLVNLTHQTSRCGGSTNST